MSPPNSSLIGVASVPNAGRGIIAKAAIPVGTLIHTSRNPAAHVIFWQYRKEVCATCFLYDRGRRLPVRLNAVGKVFCSDSCQKIWLERHGHAGSEAWKTVHDFVQKKSKCISNNHSLPALTPRPTEDEIARTWTEAEVTTKAIRHKRASESKKDITASNPPWTHVVDPDILSYLLTGLLYYHDKPQDYSSTVLELAMDPIPYRSVPDLEAHANSYLQLIFILPVDLVKNLSPSLCQTLISAAAHNSFGIRSGSSDGDEYLGYGLYPDASYFNHSCEPNLSKTRVGNVWEFRVLRDVVEGDECCITYLGGDEKDMTVLERRGRLKMHWGFQCECHRCQKESG